MFTLRAGIFVAASALLLLAACSREQQDWRAAEAADSVEAYEQFVQRHPDSELANQARERVTQLGEERDWQQASSADTAEAYRQFITQHPSGKWTQEARIRIENFSLGAQPGQSGSAPAHGGTASTASSAPGAAPVPAGTAPAKTSAPITRNIPGAVSAPAGAGSAMQSATGSGTGAPAGGATANAGSAGSAGAYRVQLGAFGTEAGANAEWPLLIKRFPAELQGLSAHVEAAQTPAGKVYRLQATVVDEGHARALCATLKQHSQGCLPVALH